MTIYRNDGSSVTIDYEFGTVRISDTRRKESYVTMDAEQFLSYFVHW